MNKREINWTWVFWISITLLFVWLLAKALGFISTPLIIEAIPYITGFAAILSGAKKLGEYAQQLTRAVTDIAEIKVEFKEVKGDIQGLRKDIHRLDKRVSVLETRMGTLALRIGA